MELGELTLWLLFFLACYYWWRMQGVREVALAAARRHCDEMSVQLLDESIALKKWWWKRDARGQLCQWRSYYFEFSSTGDERYIGWVVLLGPRVESVELEPHRITH